MFLCFELHNRDLTHWAVNKCVDKQVLFFFFFNFAKWFSFLLNFRKQILMTDTEIWIPEQILIFQKFHRLQIEPLRSSRKLYLVYLQGMIGWRWLEWVLERSCEVILVDVIHLTFSKFWSCVREGLYFFTIREAWY